MEQIAGLAAELPSPPTKPRDGTGMSERITYERNVPQSSANEGECIPIEHLRQTTNTCLCWGCLNYADASLPDTPSSIKNFFNFAYGTYASSNADEFYQNLYDHFQEEVCGEIHSQNALYPEDSDQRVPIPLWSKDEMREHFEHHGVNPSIQNVKDIKRLKILIDFAFDNVVREATDGARNIDGKQLANLEKLYKLLDSRTNQQVEKLNYYDPGANTDKSKT